MSLSLNFLRFLCFGKNSKLFLFIWSNYCCIFKAKATPYVQYSFVVVSMSIIHICNHFFFQPRIKDNDDLALESYVWSCNDIIENQMICHASLKKIIIKIDDFKNYHTVIYILLFNIISLCNWSAETLSKSIWTFNIPVERYSDYDAIEKINCKFKIIQ